jgi:hypothetical protein
LWVALLRRFLGSWPANNNDTLGLALLYYIEKLSETISSDLSEFDIAQFTLRYNDMVKSSYANTGQYAPG